MKQPELVTIILTAQIPTWFSAALESVIAQDYPHCEIIIADSSGDKFIPDLINQFPHRSAYPIRHLVFKKNQEGRLEKAIEEAKGKYIKFVSDSELLAPNCVSMLVSGLKSIENCRVAASKRQRIDPQGNIISDLPSTSSFYNEASIINGRDILRAQSHNNYNLIGELSASLFYRDDVLILFQEENLFFSIDNEHANGVEGLILYSKLLSSTDLLWYPESLVFIRSSEAYRQPHQIDGNENAMKLFYKVLNDISNHEWFDNVNLNVNEVRRARIDSPDDFFCSNIISNQLYNYNSNRIEWWNKARNLNVFQKNFLIDLVQNEVKVTRVAVIINVNEENFHGLGDTINSLSNKIVSSVEFIPIIISVKDPVIPDVDVHLSTLENYLNSINELIRNRNEEWYILVDAGSKFMQSGLIALSKNMAQADDLLAIYCDEYFYVNDAPTGVVFRPDINIDLLLSSPKTMAQHWLFRRELLLAAEGFDPKYPSSAEFDLILKLLESQGLNSVGHISEPLLTSQIKKRNILEDAQIIERHLNNRGYPNAQIALDNFYNYRLRYQHNIKPKVSIVVLANWHLPSVVSCVSTVLEKTNYSNIELIIVSDGDSSSERENWLKRLAEIDPVRIRIFNYPKSYNHGAMANIAALYAQGDYMVFMHCELAVTDSEWLENLLNHGLRPEVGIVGGKQISSDNKVRHAGYILGLNGAAGEVFRGLNDNQSSYLGRLSLDQNYSAVSGDFMLVRKSVFDELNGFDIEQPLYGDVDLCLRARTKGYMTVWTPYARMLRPATRQNPFQGENFHSSNKLKQLEEDKLFQRWMPLIANDPAFNANLSLKNRIVDICSDSELTWHPVQREYLPVFLAHNADITGCGYYRMIKPLEAMKNEGMAEGKHGLTLLSVSEFGQFKPDSLIIQRRYSNIFHNWIERIGKLHDVFKVFELDDYIFNLPMKHYNRDKFKPETTGLMRKSLSFFDRFVVSTEPLAEAMHDMHPNIMVVKNRLPVDIWGQLQSFRNQGRKPRVGWAGGSSHRGDLEMIADVVKEFTNEVEWVFMGMCPEKLRPFVHEVHYGVDISLYPETLAALNLDLALAPVEDNIFNACKSNLRLLEYGACGIPVICSDVECYRGDDLPVTRISNRFIDWRDAIRMHLADPEASARMGEALQVAVRHDWMLTGENVRNWVKAWSAN